MILIEFFANYDSKKILRSLWEETEGFSMKLIDKDWMLNLFFIQKKS
jgi:hypothetical protein